MVAPLPHSPSQLTHADLHELRFDGRGPLWTAMVDREALRSANLFSVVVEPTIRQDEREYREWSWLIRSVVLSRNLEQGSRFPLSLITDRARCTMTLEDPLWTLSRVLQDSNATAEEEEEEFDDSAVLRNTFLVYGSVLVVVFLLFCHLRLKYKNVYNLRSYVPDLKSPLAEDSYGFFSWFYHMFYVHSDEFLVHCGLDALCYVRILQMGYKICLVGVFSSLFLFPIYSTADGEASNKVVELTTAHLPATSKRFIATVVAAYIVFGYTLYLILQELTWFREQRYKFLQLPQPRNYACYIQHALVGDTNAAVARMIRESIGTSHEVSAHLRRLTPELDQWVKERDVCVGKLEHAIAEHEQTGTRPTHTEKNLTETLTGASAKPLDSIDTYSQQLLELNRKISQRIGELEVERETEATMNAIDADNVALEGETVTDRVDDLQGNKDENTGLLPKRLQRIASKAVALVGSGPADGQYINSGFLVFETLRDKQSALQLIHFGWPYMCQVFEAPDPDDSTYLGGCVRGLVVVSLFLTFVLVNWSNVGKTHHQITVGKHISLAATAALCLLWTIPMSFIASLSSVAALRAEFDFIDSALDAAPFLEPVLEIVAPLFVVIVNGLLPVILTTFTLFEGPISGAVTEASLFTKLSAFMIIQTFFVSAVSGSILQELAKIIDQPTKAIDLLADSLPTQSTYFLQIAFVTTSVTAAMEILRIVPIVLAWLRGCIGPKLTEKERNTTFVGLRPLSDPAEFCFADWTSQLVRLRRVGNVVVGVLAHALFPGSLLRDLVRLLGDCAYHQLRVGILLPLPRSRVPSPIRVRLPFAP